jgi:glycosyltransferase involved in cell wall biosynthesis
MDMDRALLEGAGHEVAQHFVDNRQVVELSSLRVGAKAVWNAAAVRELRRLVVDLEPDVLHVHTPFPLLSPAVFRLGAKPSLAVVATVHSYRYSCIQGQFYREGRVCERCAGKPLKAAGIRHRCYHDSLLASTALTGSLALHRAVRTYRHVDVWLALSPFMRRTLVAEGLAPGRIVVKPNTVPDPGEPPDGAREGVLFAGRLESSKGVGALLAAWEQMHDPPRLTILGDGALRELVERAAARSPRVVYRGWVDDATLQSELRRARFLVLPSEWYEGQPVIAVQALAAGAPLIVSDVGNFSEMVEPGVNGYRFRSGDPDSLAATVEEAWRHADRLPELCRAARRAYLESHSQDRNREILLAAYDQALRGRAARSDMRAREATA